MLRVSIDDPNVEQHSHGTICRYDFRLRYERHPPTVELYALKRTAASYLEADTSHWQLLLDV